MTPNIETFFEKPVKIITINLNRLYVELLIVNHSQLTVQKNDFNPRANSSE